MKNIHLIPTDKPDFVIFKNRHLGDRLFHWNMDLGNPMNRLNYIGQNIYITSDEEIKEGDFVIHIGNPYFQFNESMREFLCKDCKKIILTTDPDLIKDGVQAIDNEFLEWFVKNPSCESVIIHTLVHKNHFGFDKHKITYKIIIPKEEPEQFEDEFEMQSRIINKVWDEEESKQETLEEAAERCFKEMKVLNPKGGVKDFIRLAVNFGTEWQQERMYSEEEVIELLKTFDKNFNSGIVERNKGIKKWFEQFKKK